MGNGWMPAVALVAMTGCGGAWRNASAGQIGCPADEIEITDVRKGWGTRTWVATCRGRRHHCSAVSGGKSVQVSCTPEAPELDSSAIVSTAGSPPASEPRPFDPASHVSRHDRDGTAELRAWLPVGGRFKLHLIARPVAQPGRALLVLQGEGTAGAHRSCTVRMMLDGQLVEPPNGQYQVRSGHEYLSVEADFALVEGMAQTQRIVGRACNDEFRIDDRGRAVISEFVARVREEAAFVAPPPSTPPPSEEEVPEFEGGT